MKKSRRAMFPVVVLLLFFIAPWLHTSACAQTAFNVIHSFAGGSTDGANPLGGLVLSGSTLYGMTSAGGGTGCGGTGCGTAFKSDLSGNVTPLYSFTGPTSDGAAPWWGTPTLSSDGSTLYGLTSAGGAGSCANALNNIAGCGTIFKVDTTNGASYSMMKDLSSSTNPHLTVGSLVLQGGYLYGMSAAGGSGAGNFGGVSGLGTLFASDLSGKVNVLHNFGALVGDGAMPLGSLVASGTNLYGVTLGGGGLGYGAIITSDTNGNESVLHSFNGSTDGQNPVGTPILSGGVLYGTTSAGGAGAKGTIYRYDTSGGTFSLLHSFGGGSADGATPWGSLTLSADGSTLYGMTLKGGGTGCGGDGCGTVFRISTSGGLSTFKILHAFNASGTDGGVPYGSLVLSGSGVLYGMTSAGGTSAKGLIFSLGPAGVASASQSPAPGATGVAINSVVSVTFSGAMNAGTISNTTFTLTNVTAGGTAVSGTVSYDSTTNTATFTPGANLDGASTYRATLTSGITDAGGATLASAPVTWSFTTSLAPVVTAAGPTGSNVAVTSPITATFSTAMAQSTITSSSFTVTHVVSGSTVPVSGSFSYDSTTNRATFTPASSLSANTAYTVTISTGVTDATGEALAAPVIWSFFTGTAAGAPSVSITSPQAGQAGVPLNATIRAQFATDMNPATITASGTFTVAVSGGSAISGTVSYSSDIATFTPSSALSASTTYTATIGTAAQDSSGAPLPAPYTWTFTTGAASDTTAPYVTIAYPSDGSTGAASNTVIQATFVEAIDPTSVTTSTFYVTENRFGLPVAGAVSVAGNTATFVPASPIGYPYDYTATVTTGVKDLAGNAMPANYSWTFSTVDTSSPVGLNTGTASVGSVTGTGNIRVQVSSGVIIDMHAVADGNAALNSTNKPSGYFFPDGLILYQVSGLAGGDVITATITFPTPVSTNAKVYKVGQGGFYDYGSHVVSKSGNVVTLQLKDGDSTYGDDDGTANGVIADPVGVAELIPAITSPLSWSYGSLTTGQSSSQTFTISETQGGLLTLHSVTIVGTNAGDFSIPFGSDHCSNTSLTSTSCTFVVTFAPSSAGTKIAYISVPTTDPSATSLTGTLTGVSLPAATATTTTSSSGGGNTCFIATAAYGSYLDPHVAALRAFRDKRLLTCGPGRAFVAFYYKHSPPVAEFIAQHESVRAATRCVLTPIVYSVEHPYMLIVALGGIAVAGVRARRKFRV